MNDTHLHLGIQQAPIQHRAGSHAGMGILRSSEIGDLDSVELLHDGYKDRTCTRTLSIADDEDLAKVEGLCRGRLCFPRCTSIGETFAEGIRYPVDHDILRRLQEIVPRAVRHSVQLVPIRGIVVVEDIWNTRLIRTQVMLSLNKHTCYVLCSQVDTGSHNLPRKLIRSYDTFKAWVLIY